MQLLPRLDLGLTFARIEQRTCKKWVRQVLRYLLAADHQPGNLAYSISAEAFFDLVGTPSLLERYWGNQLKELVYNLNSDSLAGRSTRARLEQLVGMPQVWGINLYAVRLTKRYKLSRFAPLIEYWRRNGVKLISPPARFDYYSILITALQRIIDRGSSYQIFTDGSTVKDHPVSGASIVLFNAQGDKMADMGFPIRAFGNNYLAELAAVTIAAMTIPRETACTIFTDSMAAILAASGRTLSERELVRTPCKGWLSTLREELRTKPLIRLKHIRAHTHGTDFLSRGNEMADSTANGARIKCTNSPPIVTLDLGGVLLEFKDIVLSKGIKEDIRFILSASRARIWKGLSRQGRTLKMFRTSFQAIQKSIRAHAISSGKESVWSYFILASLRWFTPPPAKSVYPQCPLCSGQTDTIDHFLACPGLHEQHVAVTAGLQSALAGIGIKLPLVSSSWAGTTTSDPRVFPLTFLSSHYPPPSLQVLLGVVPAKLAYMIDSINCSDKAAAISGYLPLSFLKMIKLFRPLTFKEDLEDLRVKIVDLCALRYEMYRKLSWFCYLNKRAS
eukprot:TRINITY_DN2152_c0_g1_i8.p1 TRINITY_DN2152_c0_g1~~TRINITY_DN2152_c0_g1_i8.p1  ORF type:complete len:621 (-),score=-34.86 TRINITY_DN2152_c0_g1_i8:152-1831(-)